MSLEEFDKMKKEVASGNEEKYQNEPKIYETGYFLLSQQINSLRDSMDTKFETIRKENETKFIELRKEIDARFNKVDEKFNKIDEKFDKMDEKFNEIRKELNGLQKWAFAMIVTVILGFVAIYFK